MYRLDTKTPVGSNLHYFVKWTVISCIIGTLSGTAGSVFAKALRWVGGFGQEYLWNIFLAPVAGILIVWLYRTFHEEKKQRDQYCIGGNFRG